MLLRRLLAGGRRGVEDRFQGPEIAMAHDLVETLLGSDERRGHPAQNHLAVLPVGNAAGLDAYAGVRALDDVGRRQASRIPSTCLLPSTSTPTAPIMV